MLGGAAPIPASSGQTVRVRLNRSGDRQLNQALHLIVLTRLRYYSATRAYAQRRRAEGKTNREIRRCLARYVARQLYRLLEANLNFDPTWLGSGSRLLPLRWRSYRRLLHLVDRRSRQSPSRSTESPD